VQALNDNGVTAYSVVDTFEDAVKCAYENAYDGWNVLLSPACASWGMFEDFEHRGRVFKQIVKSIKEQT